MKHSLFTNKFTRNVTLVFVGIIALFVFSNAIILKISATAPFILIAASLLVVLSAAITAKVINDKIHWYESMLDALPYPLSVTDKNMNWTFINKVVEELQKVKRADIVGKHCSNWGANICNTPNCGITCLKNGCDHSFFEQWGLEFKVDTRYLLDRKGRPMGHIESVQDITFLKKKQREQAVLVESIGELSNKFVNISSNLPAQMDKNVKVTSETARTINSIREDAEKCSQYMTKMTQAMVDINEASNAIVNVTKTISDMASRTNILAINASIEAARAGEAGKGFAVVAKEVKELANKSSKSVNDTRSLINNSIEKAKLGVQIVENTAESLSKIVEGINISNQLIEEIAQFSEEQKSSIAVIYSGAEEIREKTDAIAAQNTLFPQLERGEQ